MAETIEKVGNGGGGGERRGRPLSASPPRRSRAGRASAPGLEHERKETVQLSRIGQFYPMQIAERKQSLPHQVGFGFEFILNSVEESNLYKYG